MSTKLTFQLSPCGATLELEHNVIMSDTWTDTSNSPNLVIGSGFVDSQDPTRLICHSGAPQDTKVVTLAGANWDSQLSDTGSGTCDLCTNTPNPQTWVLTNRV
jgi:hypothetical protein